MSASLAAGVADARFRRRWTLVAIFLLSCPYLVLGAVRPAGGSYTGLLFHPSDTFLYLNQVLHGHLGEWTFTNYFTYRHQPSLPIFGLYLLIGHLLPVLPTPLTLGLAFHGARLALALVFIQQVWRLCAEVVPGRAAQRVAFLFAIFTAGAGVYRVLWPFPIDPRAPPFDLSFIESSSFYSLLYSPHFVAVLLLLVVYLRQLFRVVTSEAVPWRSVIVGGCASAAASSIHPEKAALLALASFITLAWLTASHRARPRHWAAAAAMLLPAVPYVIYTYLLTASDPQISELIRQGRPRPFVHLSLAYYLIGFGLPALCALSGIPRLVRHCAHPAPGEALLWASVTASVILMLVPWRVLDHQAEGLQLALAGLAGRNLVHEVLPRIWRSKLFSALVTQSPGRARRRLRVLTVNLILILSSPTVLALAFASPRAGLADREELFLNRDDLAAVTWLQSHASRDDVVVGTPQSGQFVAAYAGTHVVFGHWDFTPNFTEEAQALDLFFTQPDSGRSYLAARGVRWLYFGPREARVAQFDPSGVDYLEPAYRHGSTVIYLVVDGHAQSGS